MTIYVYALFDPRIPETIQYVGQTTCLAERVKTHFAARDKNTKAWIKSLYSDNVAPTFKILEETTEHNAHHTESKYIAALSPPLNVRVDKILFNFQISPITSLADMEGKYIRWALDFFGGNKLAACKALGIGRQTLYNKIKSHGI